MITKRLVCFGGYRSVSLSGFVQLSMMSDVSQNINQRKFKRVNDQLNYKRKLISTHRAEVTIPTLPYEGFDLYSHNTTVKPWSLLELIVSARIFTQWPAARADSPEESFLDAHKLLSIPDQAIYFAGLYLDISPEFHRTNILRYPLVVQQELMYFGKSSARKRYILKTKDADTTLVTCYFDDVLVDIITGKGKPFPNWWREKYEFVKRNNTKPDTVKPLYSEQVFENSYRVEYDDLDHNLHTTSSSYFRMCYNAAFTNITQSKYHKITLDYFNSGTQSITSQFYRESGHGDELIVQSWENPSIDNLLHFSIIKPSLGGSERCCYIEIKFYRCADMIKSYL